MNDLNAKTIFVIDHTQYFGMSSEDHLYLDILKNKSQNDGLGMPAKIGSKDHSTRCSKSLWTCAIESSLEYCRIVWDLFPREKLIRFLISDTSSHVVNTWSTSTQNVSHIVNGLNLLGAPTLTTPVPTLDYAIGNGLKSAIEAMLEPTEKQLKEMKANGKERLRNKGRIICITSSRNNLNLKGVEDFIHNVLAQQVNLMGKHQNQFMLVEKLHLVIINVVPCGLESLVTNRSCKEFSPIFCSEIHTIAAPNLSKKLTHLIMSHYDLASTTVTGIPMKEEQNANSSANYDVEILHARNAHTVLCGNELPTSIKEGAEYETVTLKWCTPRGGGGESQMCLALHRVTPVDVTSRPSSCLINFLLNGRSVLLEMPRKIGGKITSHLLSAQGGEIFIHALQIARSCLDEIPSITDTYAGRIQDYRFVDFGNLAKTHRFRPLRSRKVDDNITKCRERIQRHTLYFPLTLGSSMIYNLAANSEFLRRITKENMDKNDEIYCQQQIYEHIYTPAKFGDILTFKQGGFKRMKDSKKADQYRLLLTELEQLIKCYATTGHHRTLLDIVKNLRNNFMNATKTESDSASSQHSKIRRIDSDSPLSPTHTIDLTNGNHHGRNRTLLDIFLQAERTQTAKRLEFSGRLCTPPGQIAKLYPHLEIKEKSENSATAQAIS